jgi:hypothetical protein
MEHAEALELVELAAVEPDGFDRLFAGDTAEAAALAGHLAGCAECTRELAEARRDAGIIHDAIRTMPSPDLRERTLAYVAAVGRPRATAPAAASELGAGDRSTTGIPRPVFVPRAQDAQQARPRTVPGGPLRWIAAIAAVLVVALAASAFFVSGQLRDRDSALAAQAREAAALARVATWSLRVGAAPDAQRVQLASTTAGSPATGSVLLSSSSREVVVVAESLAEPAAGTEFACWVEIGGARRRMGQMFFGGGIAYWVGPVPDLPALPAGTRFGVSLTDGAGQPGGTPVLEGRL